MADNKQDIIGRIRKDFFENQDFIGWFEAVYASAEDGTGFVPWAHMEPNPQLVVWSEEVDLQGNGKKALVVGCGLGDDAEYLAERGFAVTAFDISETAIEGCKKRFPETTVAYQVMDLFKLPQSWLHNFDFVVESRTIQALPYDWHKKSIGAIANTIANNGQIIVICWGRDPDQHPGGIPWALSREELALFHQAGLVEKSFFDFSKNGQRRFRVVYQRAK